MDNSLTEEELLAQAIALSLEAASGAATPSASSQEPDTQMQQGESQTEPLGTSEGMTLTLPMTQKQEKPQDDSVLADTAQSVLVTGNLLEGPTLPPVRLSTYHSMEEWRPNRECLELVMGMGISQNAARRALYYTGNDNAELAVAWVFENIENPELHQPFQPPPVTASHLHNTGPVCHSYDDEFLSEDEEEELLKMVFVVNSELKMGVGKIAAQVGHATLGLYRLLQQSQGEIKATLDKWEEAGSRKIVLKGQNVHHLLDLKRKAYELRLPNIIVHDAGRTQVDSGSLTVFALYGKTSLVDQVTGKLKLL